MITRIGIVGKTGEHKQSRGQSKSIWSNIWTTLIGNAGKTGEHERSCGQSTCDINELQRKHFFHEGQHHHTDVTLLVNSSICHSFNCEHSFTSGMRFFLLIESSIYLNIISISQLSLNKSDLVFVKNYLGICKGNDKISGSNWIDL